jgi:hypothetical protein
MAFVTSTAKLQARLAIFEAALEAVALRKSYTVDGHIYTAADEAFLGRMVASLEGRIARRQTSQQTGCVLGRAHG